jgi:hypothetical protein
MHHLVLPQKMALKLPVVGLRLLRCSLRVLRNLAFPVESSVLGLLGCQRHVFLRQVIEPELELGVLLLRGLVLAPGESVEVQSRGAVLLAVGVVGCLCLLCLLALLLEALLVACRLLARF